jgi:hypothetical protein
MATRAGSLTRPSRAILPATYQSPKQTCCMRFKNLFTMHYSRGRPRTRGDARNQAAAVSTEDGTINPDLDRFMAQRAGAKTIEVEASHLARPSAATSEGRTLPTNTASEERAVLSGAW